MGPELQSLWLILIFKPMLEKKPAHTFFLSFSQLTGNKGEEVSWLILSGRTNTLSPAVLTSQSGHGSVHFPGRMRLFCCHSALFCRYDLGAPRDMLIETDLHLFPKKQRSSLLRSQGGPRKLHLTWQVLDVKNSAKRKSTHCPS